MKIEIIRRKKLLHDLERHDVVSRSAIKTVRNEGFGELIAICDVYSAVGRRAYSVNRLNEENLSLPSEAKDRDERAAIIESIVRYEIRTTAFGRTALKNLSDYCFSDKK